MRGIELVLLVGGLGALGYYTRARWMPGAKAVGESIYSQTGGGEAARPGSGIDPGGNGSPMAAPTQGGEKRAQAAAMATSTRSPFAAQSGNASRAMVQAVQGQGFTPFSSGTGVSSVPAGYSDMRDAGGYRTK